MDWELMTSICKLLHIEWINSKVLLYSTGNYIQQKQKILRRGGKNTQKNCTKKIFMTQIITMA